MNDPNWEKAKAIFFAALEIPAATRAAFLDGVCAGDDATRREVESLLAAHEAPGEFIDRPAIAEAAEVFIQPQGLIEGQRVGAYEIGRKLGQGGMGVVYLARDTRLDRPVALKLLHADFTQDAARVRRFQQEARAASALNHPNILTIHDVGQIDGQDYIATEFVEGRTLREVISDGQVEPQTTLDIVSQVAHALEAAHLSGIVHRDIKPENLMLRSDGFVKVLDFGLVKLIEPEQSLGETQDSSSDLARTNPGTVLGTVSYMSPEQALGREIDNRSDLFSLGVVFYELLTGMRPFKGDRTAAILDGIIHHDPVPVTKVRSGLSTELDRILARALEKDREMRYQTATDLRADLKRLQRERNLTATNQFPRASQTGESKIKANRQPEKRPARAAIITVIVTLIAIAGFWFWRSLANRPTVNAGEKLLWSNASATQLTDFPGEELFPTLSPDGKSFVYVRDNHGKWDIYQQRLSGGAALNLTENSSGDNFHPAFSPDGEQIAFRSEHQGGGIFVMGALGGAVRQIANSGYNPVWSPDGKEILCSTVFVFDPAFRNIDGKLFVINVATGARREIATGQDAVGPGWSPDGERIVYWSNDKNGQRDIWTVSAHSGDQPDMPVKITNDAELDWNPVWSADGQYIYFISKRKGAPSLWRVPVNAKTGRPLGMPEAVIGPLAQIWQMSFSRDGKRLIYTERLSQEHIQAVGFDLRKQSITGQPISILQGSKQAIQPDVSPDGQWLVYVLLSGAQENLFVIKTDGTTANQLTTDQYRKRMPRWSPDGKRIIYYSNITGNYEIWAMNPDGSDNQQISFSGTKGVVYPSWSPDQRLISFCYFGEQTYLMDTGKPWLQQTPFALPRLNENGDWFIGWSWSPDGKRLAGWRANAQGQYPGVYLYSLSSQQYAKAASIGGWPAWFTDNRHLVCVHDGKIFLIDALTGNTREIFSIPGRILNNPVVSGEGDRIYYSVLTTESDVHLLTLE